MAAIVLPPMIVVMIVIELTGAGAAEEKVLLQYPPQDPGRGIVGIVCCCPDELTKEIGGKVYCEVPLSMAAEWIKRGDIRLKGFFVGKAVKDAVENTNAAPKGWYTGHGH